MRVEVGRRAQADFDDIFLTIAADKPNAAARMIDRLREAIIGLADFPYAGRLASDGVRELVTVHPYIIIYRIREGGVEVGRILHAAQDR